MALTSRRPSGSRSLLTDKVFAAAYADPRRHGDALPSTIRAQGERASRRFIEFFTANIPDRNARMGLRTLGKAFLRLAERLEVAEPPPLRSLHRPRFRPGVE